jgi:hypothetical protein
MAICPSGAICVGGLSYDKDLFELASNAPKHEHLLDLIKCRRSIRTFNANSVPRRLLQEIVDAISYASMGFPPHKLELTIVERREVIERALPLIVEGYEKLSDWMHNPIKRFLSGGAFSARHPVRCRSISPAG